MICILITVGLTQLFVFFNCKKQKKRLPYYHRVVALQVCFKICCTYINFSVPFSSSLAILQLPHSPCRAKVAYIDYEGRSDGDSIKKIINQMKPRQLVIVHGPPEASADLAASCKAFSKEIKVYTPKLHETVDATSETHIYQVRA